MTCHGQVGSDSKNGWIMIHTNHPNMDHCDISSKFGWYMSVVTYIELKSGWNHPNLDDLYDPILDEIECVFKSSKIGSFV